MTRRFSLAAWILIAGSSLDENAPVLIVDWSICEQESSLDHRATLIKSGRQNTKHVIMPKNVLIFQVSLLGESGKHIRDVL